MFGGEVTLSSYLKFKKYISRRDSFQEDVDEITSSVKMLCNKINFFNEKKISQIIEKAKDLEQKSCLHKSTIVVVSCYSLLKVNFSEDFLQFLCDTVKCKIFSVKKAIKRYNL